MFIKSIKHSSLKCEIPPKKKLHLNRLFLHLGQAQECFFSDQMLKHNKGKLKMKKPP